MANRDVLLEKLGEVNDPELMVDIVSLGLIYDVKSDAGRVKVDMTLTSPGCPAAPLIKREVKAALRKLDGVESVDVTFVWSPPWKPELMSDEAKLELGYAI